MPPTCSIEKRAGSNQRDRRHVRRYFIGMVSRISSRCII
jgi:hypothetical protein